MMICVFLWWIELPTEIRRQIKVKVVEIECESKSEKEKTTTLNAICTMYARVFVFARTGAIIVKSACVCEFGTVLPYCFASIPHLSAVISGINLYINCCHSVRLFTFSTNWAALLTCLRSSEDCVNIAFVLSVQSQNNNTKRPLYFSFSLESKKKAARNTLSKYTEPSC